MNTFLFNIAMALQERASASIKMETCRLISLALTSSWKHAGAVNGKPNGSLILSRISLTALSRSTITTSKKEISNLI